MIVNAAHGPVNPGVSRLTGGPLRPTILERVSIISADQGGAADMGILDGKVAIVTGASRGIGAEIARRIGQAGAAVAVTARTTGPGTSPFPGTIGETADQVRADGGEAVAIRADLSKPEDRERLVSE